MLLKVTNSGPLASFSRPPFRPPDVLQSAAFLSAVGQGSLQGSTVICSVPSSSLARAGRFCHAAPMAERRNDHYRHRCHLDGPKRGGQTSGLFASPRNCRPALTVVLDAHKLLDNSVTSCIGIGMKSPPKLHNDFIVDESEYQACKAWLNQANEETILHPLDDPELEIQRQRIKGLVAEYEENWRHSAK